MLPTSPYDQIAAASVGFAATIAKQQAALTLTADTAACNSRIGASAEGLAATVIKLLAGRR